MDLEGYFITFVFLMVLIKTLIESSLINKFRSVLFLLLLFFGAENAVFTQVVPVEVKKSTDKVIIDGKVFYVHVVREGQTLYSISKAYGISQKEISIENPTVVFGLRIGQAIKIPVEPMLTGEDEEIEPENFIYHPIQENETIYALSKRYGVTEEEILEQNPDLVIEDIDIGTVIKIPKKIFTPEKESFGADQESFVYHRVEKGETLYSLSRKYDVSIRQIRRVNVQMKGSPKEGEYLRIPVAGEEDVIVEPEMEDNIDISLAEDTAEFMDEMPSSFYGKSINVALMLPFYLDENDERVVIDSSEVDEFDNVIEKITERDENWIYPRSYNYIEFYEGALLAVKSLQKNGLSINLSVFDTERDSATVQEIINNGDLRQMDLIIGPAFTHNLRLVAAYGEERRIPVVSPLASRNVILDKNPYLFQVRPTFETEVEKLTNFLSGFYDKNIVMIHPGDSLEDPQVDLLKRRLFYRLSFYTFFNEVVFKEVVYNDAITKNDSINSIEHALSRDIQNIVIIPSDTEPFVSNIVSTLNTLSADYDILLVGYQSWQRFRNIELQHFYDLNLHICTPFIVDYTKDNVKEFIRSFRESFYSEPEPFSYAWQGHDITYFFGTGVARYGRRFRNYCFSHRVDLLESEYMFRRTSSEGGFENKQIHIIEYKKDLEISRVAAEKQDVWGNR